MAQKAPQVLSLTPTSTAGEDNSSSSINTAIPSTSPVLQAPKSPRSAFKFSSKQTRSYGDQPSMQVADQQSTQSGLPTSPSVASFQNQLSTPAQSERHAPDRPVRSGFFSNYKSARTDRMRATSANRQVAEGRMSADGDRPMISEQASAPEVGQYGKACIGSTRVKYSARMC